MAELNRTALGPLQALGGGQGLKAWQSDVSVTKVPRGLSRRCSLQDRTSLELLHLGWGLLLGVWQTENNPSSPPPRTLCTKSCCSWNEPGCLQPAVFCSP